MALVLVATVRPQESQLLLGFNAFRNDRHAKGFSHPYYRVGYNTVVAIVREIRYECSIDFERCKGEALQIRQRGVTRPEIVDGKPNAHFAQG